MINEYKGICKNVGARKEVVYLKMLSVAKVRIYSIGGR